MEAAKAAQQETTEHARQAREAAAQLQEHTKQARDSATQLRQNMQDIQQELEELKRAEYNSATEAQKDADLQRQIEEAAKARASYSERQYQIISAKVDACRQRLEVATEAAAKATAEAEAADSNPSQATGGAVRASPPRGGSCRGCRAGIPPPQRERQRRGTLLRTSALMVGDGRAAVSISMAARAHRGPPLAATWTPPAGAGPPSYSRRGGGDRDVASC